MILLAHRYADIKIHRYTYTHIHGYTDTQIHRYTDSWSLPWLPKNLPLTNYQQSYLESQSITPRDHNQLIFLEKGLDLPNPDLQWQPRCTLTIYSPSLALLIFNAPATLSATSFPWLPSPIPRHLATPIKLAHNSSTVLCTCLLCQPSTYWQHGHTLGYQRCTGSTRQLPPPKQMMTTRASGKLTHPGSLRKFIRLINRIIKCNISSRRTKANGKGWGGRGMTSHMISPIVKWLSLLTLNQASGVRVSVGELSSTF